MDRVTNANRAIRRLMQLVVEFYALIFAIKPDLDTPEWLLLAGMKKSTVLSDCAIAISDICAVEEVWSIVRTLTELIVNSAYLENASAIELTRFIQFDVSNMFRQTSKLREHVTNPVPYPKELIEHFAKRAKEAQVATQRTEKDTSWSQYGLLDRAKEADKKSEQKAFAMMVLSSATRGNAAVHSTMQSMVWYIESVQSGNTHPDPERLSDLGLALEQIAFVLSVLCHHIDQRFRFGKRSVITGAATFGPNGLRVEKS